MARPYRPSSCSALFRRAPKESERDGSPPSLEKGETGHRSEPLMSSLLWAGVEVEEEEGSVDPLMFSTVEDIVFGGSRSVSLWRLLRLITCGMGVLTCTTEYTLIPYPWYINWLCWVVYAAQAMC